MTIERYSHVMHITSNVSGQLAAGRDAFDALRACLPAGTVSGAPKVRAMQIIDEIEPHRRGPYAGAVGYVDFGGNMDTCIALRTLVVQGDNGLCPGRRRHRGRQRAGQRIPRNAEQGPRPAQGHRSHRAADSRMSRPGGRQSSRGHSPRRQERFAARGRQAVNQALGKPPLMHIDQIRVLYPGDAAGPTRDFRHSAADDVRIGSGGDVEWRRDGFGRGQPGNRACRRIAVGPWCLSLPEGMARARAAAHGSADERDARRAAGPRHGNAAGKAALDMAWWNLKALHEGRPLAELLSAAAKTPGWSMSRGAHSACANRSTS